jgi:hypothetical protein
MSIMTVKRGRAGWGVGEGEGKKKKKRVNNSKNTTGIIPQLSFHHLLTLNPSCHFKVYVRVDPPNDRTLP